MTLMQEAKRGRVPSSIEAVAKREGIEPAKLAALVAAGRVVIPRNIRRERMQPTGVGEHAHHQGECECGHLTKPGLSAKRGGKGASGSGGGRRRGDGPVHGRGSGCSAAHDSGCSQRSRGQRSPLQCSRQEGPDQSQGMFNALEKHAKDGVDFVTVHVGVNKNSLERLRLDPRVLGVVSRGGSLTMKYISETGEDNPYYSEYDYLLEMAKEYDLTLSLGDGLRPGCIEDASDRAKYMEFIMLGELVKRARAAGVQAMVEGPGHVPADEIETSVKAMKHLTDGAPLYLLGPLVTDIAPGYDHITAAMGGVIAGMAGADFLCATTPSEHLDLPTIEDVIEGTYVTRVAAHAADLTRPGVRERARAWDLQMAHARAELNWEGQFQAAINPARAKQIRHRRGVETDTCTMCSELCAIRLSKEAMEKGLERNVTRYLVHRDFMST